MGYKLREIEAESKFFQELTLEAITQAVLAESGVRTPRERKLNLQMTVFLTIVMHFYVRLSLGEVMSKLAQGLRYIWPDPDYPVAKDSAISQRRYQLGVQPLVALFQRACRPLVTPETHGAFLFGLRLMAIDGTIEEVPDTPERR